MKAVIFDLDGTLIDSHEDIALAVNSALAEVGLPTRPIAEIQTFIGEGSRKLMGQAVAPREELFERAHQAWELAYRRALLQHTLPYPGIVDLVTDLARRVPLAIHTNKPGRFARAIVDGLKLSESFREVLGDGDGQPRKPEPQGALHVLELLDARPLEAFYVGDSQTDLHTAQAAGIPFVGVGWGFGRQGLAKIGAAPLAENVPALAALLR